LKGKLLCEPSGVPVFEYTWTYTCR